MKIRGLLGCGLIIAVVVISYFTPIQNAIAGVALERKDCLDYQRLSKSNLVFFTVSKEEQKSCEKFGIAMADGTPYEIHEIRKTWCSYLQKVSWWKLKYHWIEKKEREGCAKIGFPIPEKTPSSVQEAME